MTRKPIWIVLCVLALVTLACSFTARQDNSDSASGGNNGERMFESFGCAGLVISGALMLRVLASIALES